MRTVRDFLATDLQVDLIDSSDRVAIHQKIARSKPEFLRVIQDQHEMIQDLLMLPGERGITVELGSGSIPFATDRSDVLTSDVVFAAGLSMSCDAARLPFKTESINNIVAFQTFHHFPHPMDFFSEASRVLTPGGRIVLVEPFHNRFCRMIYPRLFQTEGFDQKGAWVTEMTGPMTGANQALSYCVFVRDRLMFRNLNPNLSVIHSQALPEGLRYLLSGGLNFRRIAPRWLFSILRRCERRIPGFLRTFSIHWVVVIEKRGSAKG